MTFHLSCRNLTFVWKPSKFVYTCRPWEAYMATAKMPNHSAGPVDVLCQESTEIKYYKVIYQRGVDIVAVGATCIVETTKGGNIIKSPYPEKGYDTGAELALKACIYKHMGPHQRLVPIIS